MSSRFTFRPLSVSKTAEPRRHSTVCTEQTNSKLTSGRVKDVGDKTRHVSLSGHHLQLKTAEPFCLTSHGGPAPLDHSTNMNADNE